MLVKRRKLYGAELTDLMLTATVGVERKLNILRTFVVGSTKLYVLKIVKDIEKFANHFFHVPGRESSRI